MAGNIFKLLTVCFKYTYWRDFYGWSMDGQMNAIPRYQCRMDARHPWMARKLPDVSCTHCNSSNSWIVEVYQYTYYLSKWVGLGDLLGPRRGCVLFAQTIWKHQMTRPEYHQSQSLSELSGCIGRGKIPSDLYLKQFLSPIPFSKRTSPHLGNPLARRASISSSFVSVSYWPSFSFHCQVPNSFSICLLSSFKSFKPAKVTTTFQGFYEQSIHPWFTAFTARMSTSTPDAMPLGQAAVNAVVVSSVLLGLATMLVAVRFYIRYRMCSIQPSDWMILLALVGDLSLIRDFLTQF